MRAILIFALAVVPSVFLLPAAGASCASYAGVGIACAKAYSSVTATETPNLYLYYSAGEVSAFVPYTATMISSAADPQYCARVTGYCFMEATAWGPAGCNTVNVAVRLLVVGPGFSDTVRACGGSGIENPVGIILEVSGEATNEAWAPLRE